MGSGAELDEDAHGIEIVLGIIEILCDTSEGGLLEKAWTGEVPCGRCGHSNKQTRTFATPWSRIPSELNQNKYTASISDLHTYSGSHWRPCLFAFVEKRAVMHNTIEMSEKHEQTRSHLKALIQRKLRRKT